MKQRFWLFRRRPVFYLENSESFHVRFRDECLNREQLHTLTEIREVIGAIGGNTSSTAWATSDASSSA